MGNKQVTYELEDKVNSIRLSCEYMKDYFSKPLRREEILLQRACLEGQLSSRKD